MSDVGETDERNSAIRRREFGGAQRKKVKGKSSCSFSDHAPTHGYLGYPRSGSGGRRGRTLVLAPPCGGRPRTLILHHPPHRLLPPDILTPRAGVMTSGVQADLGGGAQGVAVGLGTAIRARPQGVSIGHSLAAHTCHTDLGDGHAPHRGLIVYTHFLGLWWGGGAWWVVRQYIDTHTNTHRWTDGSCTHMRKTKTVMCTDTHDHSNTRHTEVINVMAEK